MMRNDQDDDDNDDDDDEDDRLRSIHDELSQNMKVGIQEQQQSKKPDPWLPLESNPDIFTSFARRIAALPEEWSFVDVWGFDDETLDGVPKPVAAVILLFPTTDNIYDGRAKEKVALKSRMREGRLSPEARKAYHLEQVASFGNACGTIAAIHALTNAGLIANGANNDSPSSSPVISGPIATFRDSTSHLATSKERGQLLVSSSILHNISDEAATSTQ